MGQRHPPATSQLSGLPAVHELAAAIGVPHPLAVIAARLAIDEQRTAILDGASAISGERILARARDVAEELRAPSLRRVINATGVIIHTNLGRSPLPAAAQAAVARAAGGYSNLELRLGSGERGSRHAHVEGVLRELSGAPAAAVVNNGAAAVLLAVAALAGPGRAVIVSRGQLIEIGGGFRIPDVVAQSGAMLLEVGTTNRTRLRDYQRAIEESELEVAAILRVHQSNFRTIGFVEDVAVGSLCGLGVPVIDDLGSGLIADPGSAAALSDEPSIASSIAAGATLVCCSGDKLLGGPQAGLLLGSSDAVAAANRHPLARALRIDKLSLAALEATLKLYLDPERALQEIPVLAMLRAGDAELKTRASAIVAGVGGEIVTTRAKVGGGALPLLELEGPAVALESPLEPGVLARALRAADPPVIARIHEGRVLLDPRTVHDDELGALVEAVRAALS